MRELRELDQGDRRDANYGRIQRPGEYERGILYDRGRNDDRRDDRRNDRRDDRRDARRDERRDSSREAPRGTRHEPERRSMIREPRPPPVGRYVTPTGAAARGANTSGAAAHGTGSGGGGNKAVTPCHIDPELRKSMPIAMARRLCHRDSQTGVRRRRS